jgi:hypothetical protein
VIPKNQTFNIQNEIKARNSNILSCTYHAKICDMNKHHVILWYGNVNMSFLQLLYVKTMIPIFPVQGHVASNKRHGTATF